MTRISILDRSDMNDEQGQLFDEVKSAGGPLGGPYWAYIRNPKLMRLVQDTSNCLRAGGLTSRERQIAIMAVIRHWGADYPWAVQARSTLAAGVEPEIIDAINAGAEPTLSDPREKAAYEVASELLANKGLSDATYANAEEVFGLETLISLVGIIGQFSMTCCTANAFDLTPPDDVPHRIKE
jgi:4-carboxymuconolactone decarboxylase